MKTGQNKYAQDQDGQADKGRRLLRKIDQLRNEKMSLGSLMRIVRSQKYEKVTEDLKEVHYFKHIIPEIKQYIGHFKTKRDASCKKRR